MERKRYFGKRRGSMEGDLRISPLSFLMSPSGKKSTVHKALEGYFWVTQVNTDAGLSLDHIVQFANLWEMLQAVHLDPHTPDSITWKLTNDGHYSSKTAYTMQFLGHTKSHCHP
jgi:hypothetical protein